MRTHIEGPNRDHATLLQRLRGGLIVSCQALPDEPLHGAWLMARMALAALEGGAAGIRANGQADVAAIRAACPDTPIIGLFKADLPGYEVRITPTLEHALAVAEAGCDIIALDATLRAHPAGSAATLIAEVRRRTGLPVLADISTLEEGLAAVQAGAELVGTTLSGYTAYSPQQEAPDLTLVAALALQAGAPVLAEGRIATPEQALQALDAGAFAVVVGSAITRPQWITRRFTAAIAGQHDHPPSAASS